MTKRYKKEDAQTIQDVKTEVQAKVKEVLTDDVRKELLTKYLLAFKETQYELDKEYSRKLDALILELKDVDKKERQIDVTLRKAKALIGKTKEILGQV